MYRTLANKHKKVGTCALCREVRALRKSHIVPDFAYAPIYDEAHKLIAFPPDDVAAVSNPQQGMRDRLLCGDCEQYLNRHFEQPFQSYWIMADSLARLGTSEMVVLADVPYEAFKLFHLSVLWRASVCGQGSS